MVFPNRARVTDADLEMLVWCAISWDRRLPNGLVPNHIWEALSPEARARINRWKDNDDPLGAERRKFPWSRE